jgi:hypothetical protein
MVDDATHTMSVDECRAGASKSDDERKALASVSDE